MNRLDYLNNRDSVPELKLEAFSYVREIAAVFKSNAANRVSVNALRMNYDVFVSLCSEAQKEYPGIIRLDDNDSDPSYVGTLWQTGIFIDSGIGPHSIAFQLNNHTDFIEDWSQIMSDSLT